MENSFMCPYPGDPAVDGNQWDDERPGMGKSYAKSVKGTPLGSQVWDGSQTEEPRNSEANPPTASGLELEEIPLPVTKPYNEDSGDDNPWNDLSGTQQSYVCGEA
jgi:hypothetical protein